MSKGLLIVVSGFTGSGKGTVLQKLTEMAPEKIYSLHYDDDQGNAPRRTGWYRLYFLQQRRI